MTTEKLGRAWGAVGHLNSVADTAELRAAFNENLPCVTEFYTRLGADERLYAKYKALAASEQGITLSAPANAPLDNALRGFVLGGARAARRSQRALRCHSGTTKQPCRNRSLST